MTDTARLRNAIDVRGIKYTHIAKSVGLSYYGLLKKIENDSEFKASEITKISEILSLSNKDRDAIFFAK